MLITMFAWEWLLRGIWLRPLCAHSGPTLDSLEAPNPKRLCIEACFHHCETVLAIMCWNGWSPRRTP